ncbi:MAG TPA: DUF167 domain-containing protein [Thermomicrobiales bacterium]|nr:DUF167 domain-containing protein [Thermomicrobiales bacterium]
MNEDTRPRAVQDHTDGVVLSMLVTPRSSSTGIVSLDDDVIRVRLTAPPVDGKANTALTSYLAGVLDVPKRNVEVLTGSSGRRKRVRVTTEMGSAAVTRLLRDAVGR